MTRLLGLLGGFPWTLIAMAGIAVWGGIGHLRAHDEAAEFAKYRARASELAKQATDREREEERRRQEAQQEVGRVQALARAHEAAVARADGAAAALAVRGLRDAVAAARVRPTCPDPSAAGDGAAATAAFGDLLLTCSEEHQAMAADATAALGAAVRAGIECEQRYDALRQKGGSP